MKNVGGFSYTLSAFMLIALLAFLGGYYLALNSKMKEGFASYGKPCNVCSMPKKKCACPCNVCDKPKLNCGCNPIPKLPKTCDECGMSKSKCGCSNMIDSVGPDSMNNAIPPASGSRSLTDLSKYVLRSTVPPCPPMPDMTRYMLKTECPSQPDMSKYVLKASVPKCPPCISTCSKPCKIGECPPCPRPRCPTMNCPEPKPCPACPQVNVEPCQEPKIQCKASAEPYSKVRPMLASTSQFGL